MDFKRISWIFLMVFSFLNIFLLTIYREADNEENVVYRADQQIPIEDRLKSENIKFAKSFSTQHPKGYYLSGKPTDLNQALADKREILGEDSFLNASTSENNEKLTYTIHDKKWLSEKKQVEAVLKNFLQQEDQILFGQEYAYLADDSSFTKDYPFIVATQSYENIPIDDSSSRLEIALEKQNENYLLLSYTQTHISDLIPLRESMKLYSESEIIDTLYVNNKISNNATIEWTHLAYTLTLKVRGQNVYVPAWFVKIKKEDGSIQIEKINALTNRVITNSQVQKVENT
ncbi:MAG TPA: two-component system regulatory protein YycI [Tetragenococcus sp.]|nr:two-component system regulatory protein YycI [Tetragenococcus sp.]